MAERFAELSGRPVPDLVLPTKVFSASTGMRQPTVPPLVDLFAQAAEGRTSDLVGTQPVLDATSRISLGKAAAAMGWDAGAALSVRIEGSRVLLSRSDEPGDASGGGRPATSICARLDSQRRLTLTPGAKFALGVAPGAQVQVIADPLRGNVMFVSLARALKLLMEGPE
ncbi:hypothetical protein [Nocardioides scoriae]|uniref:hypothetical protein n=1 Tax=Nocardioides scoriae TaxID=642780 RepID=UPI0012F8F19D|nr:hypothetical protein [Nocardioides scoriae]